MVSRLQECSAEYAVLCTLDTSPGVRQTENSRVLQRGCVKSFSFLLLALCTGVAFAQQSGTGVPVDTGVPAGIVNNPIQSVFGGLVEHNSFSYFGFADGLYDHVGNRPGADNSAGVLVGGGADLAHLLRNGSLALAYRGDYRGYT